MEKTTAEKIPFDISFRKEIEGGIVKVETASGQPVRIICWDAKSSNREDIIALAEGSLGSENVMRYDDCGHLISDSANRRTKDLLLIIPSPKFKCGSIVKYKGAFYEVSSIKRLSVTNWTYVLEAAFSDDSTCYVKKDDEDKMELCMNALSPLERTLASAIRECGGSVPSPEKLKVIAETIENIARHE